MKLDSQKSFEKLNTLQIPHCLDLNCSSHFVTYSYSQLTYRQYIYTFQRDTQCSSTDCLLMHRCQLYMFRTVTVHPQELLFRCCMCRLCNVLIRPAGTPFEEELVYVQTLQINLVQYKQECNRLTGSLTYQRRTALACERGLIILNAYSVIGYPDNSLSVFSGQLPSITHKQATTTSFQFLQTRYSETYTNLCS